MAVMTDQTESVHAELLADLDFYDEDHWRNVMRQYPGAQDAIRKAAAAIRALEARVREVEEQRDTAMTDRHDEMAELRADRDRIAAELRGTQTRLSEMAGEVEKWKATCAERNGIHERKMALLQAELAAAREELAQRREHMRRGIKPGRATGGEA